MKLTFESLCEVLEKELIQSYTEGITLSEAEKLSGQFLHAQMKVSNELAKVDLDSRMRKSGVKAVKATVYLEAVQGAEKKPTESALEHTINSNGMVSKEQEHLDRAEVSRAELERYYDIFREGHVYFRQMSKGVQG